MVDHAENDQQTNGVWGYLVTYLVTYQQLHIMTFVEHAQNLLAVTSPKGQIKC